MASVFVTLSMPECAFANLIQSPGELAGCASSQRSRAARSLKARIGRPARSSVMQQFDGSLVSAANRGLYSPGDSLIAEIDSCFRRFFRHNTFLRCDGLHGLRCY